MSYREVALREMGLAPVWRDRRAAPAAPEHGRDALDTGLAGTTAPPLAPDEPNAAADLPQASRQFRLSQPPQPSQAAQKPALQQPAAAPDPARSATIARMDWVQLKAAVPACTACGLAATRTQAVFGVGAENADWMVIGEAPGAEEDARGEPFVGQAGKLLDAMLASVGLSRDPSQKSLHNKPPGGPHPSSVFIANVLKCRPPGNRNPEPLEVAQCVPHLHRQVELVNPKVILLMGRFAAQALLGTEATIASLRGKVHQVAGRPAIVTYHPAYLLRNLPDKAKAWQDLRLAVKTMREINAERNSS